MSLRCTSNHCFQSCVFLPSCRKDMGGVRPNVYLIHGENGSPNSNRTLIAVGWSDLLGIFLVWIRLLQRRLVPDASLGAFDASEQIESLFQFVHHELLIQRFSTLYIKDISR
jgi:hypothetical protein